MFHFSTTPFGRTMSTQSCINGPQKRSSPASAKSFAIRYLSRSAWREAQKNIRRLGFKGFSHQNLLWFCWNVTYVLCSCFLMLLFFGVPFSWSEKQLKPKPCESVNGQVTSPLGHGQGLPRTSSPRCQRLRLRATKRNGGLELSWRAYPPVNVYIANWKITQLKDCHVQ
jgi:hypothetical protein